MKPSRLTAVLSVMFKARQQPLIKGPPGCAKTAVVLAAAKAANMEVVLEHPAVADPTDAKGLPCIQKDGTAHFAPIGMMAQLLKATKPTLCLLDDFGQASHGTQAAYMQVIHGKRLNGFTLPECVMFAICTNDTGHKAGVNAILEPVKSRFHAILELEVDHQEWVQWALGNDIAEEVISFIRFRPTLLHDFEATRELTNSASPRTWHHASDLVKVGLTDMDLLTGCVGKGPAVEFLSFLRVYQTLPDIDQILLAPDKTEVPRDPATKHAVCTALEKRSTKDNLGRVLTYLKRMGKEYEVLTMCSLLKGPKAAETTQNRHFTEWANENADTLG